MVLNRVFINVQRYLSVQELRILGVDTAIRFSVLFRTDGVIEFSDAFKNKLSMMLPNVGVALKVELYEDVEENTLAYKYVFDIFYVWVFFKFVSNKIKITISGVLPAPITLKLPFQATKIFHEGGEKRIWAGNFDRRTGRILNGLGFDWSDILVNSTFDEGVLKIDVPAIFSLDPAIITTTSALFSTVASFQVKGFYAEGKFWEFVYNGAGGMNLYNSVDGITWAFVETVGANIATSACFTCVYEPKTNTVVIAFSTYISDIETGYLRVNKGTLSSPINWLGEQVVASAIWTEYDSPTIDVWYDEEFSHYQVEIAYNKHYEDGITFTDYPYVVSGVFMPGWSTITGFPYRLSAINTYPQPYGVIVKHFAIEKFGCAYSRIRAAPEVHEIKAKFWDHSTWSPERTVESVSGTDGIPFTSAIAAVHRSDMDEIDVSWLRKVSTTYHIYFNSVGPFGAGTPISIQSGVLVSTRPSMCMYGASLPYVFWSGSPTANHIYYKTQNIESPYQWLDAVDWIDESTEVLTDYGRTITVYDHALSPLFIIGLMYMTKTESPYNVKFAYLGTLPPPPAVAMVMKFHQKGTTTIYVSG